jgi:hypothetical protein
MRGIKTRATQSSTRTYPMPRAPKTEHARNQDTRHAIVDAHATQCRARRRRNMRGIKTRATQSSTRTQSNARARRRRNMRRIKTRAIVDAHATQRRARRRRNMRGIKSGRERQLRLPLAAARTWGGARKGAGRKPRGRPSMPHTTRPKVDPRHPVQVTIRATPGLPSLRSPQVFAALRHAIARASVDRFRVIHFSLQQDHGHFIVEGDEARRARGGIHGLAIRLALAVNRVLGRKGKVVGDRYHARALTTPRQMRTSLVYVLLNFRKHLRAPACIDPRSSGPHFSGWARPPVAASVAAATALPSTWIARIGWLRAGGPLRVEEHPATAPRPRPT